RVASLLGLGPSLDDVVWLHGVKGHPDRDDEHLPSGRSRHGDWSKSGAERTCDPGCRNGRPGGAGDAVIQVEAAPSTAPPAVEHRYAIVADPTTTTFGLMSPIAEARRS